VLAAVERQGVVEDPRDVDPLLPPRLVDEVAARVEVVIVGDEGIERHPREVIVEHHLPLGKAAKLVGGRAVDAVDEAPQPIPRLVLIGTLVPRLHVRLAWRRAQLAVLHAAAVDVAVRVQAVRLEEGLVDGLQLRVDALVLAVEGDVDVAGARHLQAHAGRQVVPEQLHPGGALEKVSCPCH
jgi:hypothetical protein